MSTSMLNSFAEHKTKASEDTVDDGIKSSNEENSKTINVKTYKDDDFEKEIHTKPLDVSVRFPGDKNRRNPKSVSNPNLNKQDNFQDYEDNKSSVNLEDPFENKESILDAADSDLPDTNSVSSVLVSPLSLNHKKGLFQRAYSDPSATTTNERTPLTSSSSDCSNNTVNKMKGYKSFSKSKSISNDSMAEVAIRNNLIDNTEKEEEDKTKQTFKSLASFATLTKWWKKSAESKKKKRDKIEEKKMRLKLQYHFMTPFEKYKLGRKPWKLGVQILKILVVTTQVKILG